MLKYDNINTVNPPYLQLHQSWNSQICDTSNVCPHSGTFGHANKYIHSPHFVVKIDKMTDCDTVMVGSLNIMRGIDASPCPYFQVQKGLQKTE